MLEQRFLLTCPVFSTVFWVHAAQSKGNLPHVLSHVYLTPWLAAAVPVGLFEAGPVKLQLQGAYVRPTRKGTVVWIWPRCWRPLPYSSSGQSALGPSIHFPNLPSLYPPQPSSTLVSLGWLSLDVASPEFGMGRQAYVHALASSTRTEGQLRVKEPFKPNLFWSIFKLGLHSSDPIPSCFLVFMQPC